MKSLKGTLTKICTVCKRELSYEKDFCLAKKGKEGRRGWCKDCSKDYRIKHADRAAICSKNWREKNKTKHQADVRFLGYKKQGLKISREEYDYLYYKQAGNCAICGKSEKDNGKKLCLDHCHTTLKIRGFLCNDCNIAIGKFKDNIHWLHKAILYLCKKDGR